jgi:hypothetical protein
MYNMLEIEMMRLSKQYGIAGASGRSRFEYQFGPEPSNKRPEQSVRGRRASLERALGWVRALTPRTPKPALSANR